MAGGTFTKQNRIRPGAYMKFNGVPNRNSITGARGVVSFAAPLGWGPEKELITITVEDIYTNRLEALVGYGIFDVGAKLIRAALENAHTLLLYRGDEGGDAATATISVGAAGASFTVNAKYPGELGNKISVSVETFDNKYSVKTFYGSVLKDEQFVNNIEELVENDFVTFTGSGVITQPSIATLLTGGTNGTFDTATYNAYLSLLGEREFDTLAAYSFQDTAVFTGESIKTFIQTQRDIKGMKCQAVINQYVSGNYEAIISTSNQGVVYQDGTEFTGDEMVIWVAGATAGASAFDSNTYKVVTNAVRITNDVLETNIESLITQGYLLLSKRRDGAIVIEKDINTLTVMREDTTEAFKNNKTVRLMDTIANEIANTFEQNYVGKINNDPTGQALFKAAIINYLSTLQLSGGIINFNSNEDVTVEAGEQPDSFYSTIYIQPTYAVEKLYMVVNVR